MFCPGALAHVFRMSDSRGTLRLLAFWLGHTALQSGADLFIEWLMFVGDTRVAFFLLFASRVVLLSCCRAKPGPKADNTRHAEAKADTTSGVGRSVVWHLQATCPPSRSWSRRLAHLSSRKTSFSLQCPSLHLRRVDFIAPVPALSPVQAKYTARGLWLRTSILSVGCAHFDSLKAALTPSCVGLGWSCSVGDVMFSRIQPCFFCLQHLCARRWRSSVLLFRTQFQSAKVVRCATPSSSDLWSVMLASCSAVDMPALLSV